MQAVFLILIISLLLSMIIIPIVAAFRWQSKINKQHRQWSHDMCRLNKQMMMMEEKRWKSLN